MQRKKSRFWSFIWSFIPGAGEMYMGFMKMGLSLMLGFSGMIAIVAITNFGALSVFPIVMYFYSFFHANNLASLDNQTFYAIRDQYLLGMDGLDSMDKLSAKMTGRRRKIVAAVLILIGVVMLWQAVFNLLCDIFGWDNMFLSRVYYFMRDDVPRFVIGIAIVWIGIAMIRGKKEKIDVDEQSDYAEQNYQQNSYMEQNRQQNIYAGQDQQQNSYAEQNRQQSIYAGQDQQRNSYAEQKQQQDSYMEQNRQ